MNRRESIPEPPLSGSQGDQGVTALFLLLLILFLVVGFALYVSAGLLFPV
jgi:hypothetical protein